MVGPLKLYVGGAGGPGSVNIGGGGGGCSAVTYIDSNSVEKALIVAGGGGGQGANASLEATSGGTDISVPIEDANTSISGHNGGGSVGRNDSFWNVVGGDGGGIGGAKVLLQPSNTDTGYGGYGGGGASFTDGTYGPGGGGGGWIGGSGAKGGIFGYGGSSMVSNIIMNASSYLANGVPLPSGVAPPPFGDGYIALVWSAQSLPDPFTYNDATKTVITGLTNGIPTSSEQLPLIRPSVTTIGASAFANCAGLTGPISITSKITSIGNGAFINCVGLTGSLVIPSTVTSIGSGAFINCFGLTAISYKSGTTIGRGAFTGCVTPTTY